MGFSDLDEPALNAVIKCLTPDRLKKYLERTDTDQVRAFRLYEWNTDLSSSLYDTIQCFEVIVRNAICAALEANEKYGKPLYEDPKFMGYYPELRDEFSKCKKKAEENRNGFPPSRHDVVAASTLNIWRELSKTTYFPSVWKKGWAAAFPNRSLSKGKGELVILHKNVDETLKLRNRIAHHESILGPLSNPPGSELQKKFDLMIETIGWVDNDAKAWVESRSTFATVLTRNPAPDAFKAPVVPPKAVAKARR